MQRFSMLALAAIGLILGAAGCTGGNSEYKPTTDLKKAPPLHDEHEHGAPGPHGGSLVELGEEEFHAEVFLDHDAHIVRVFVLGKDAKTPEPTTATEVTLTPEGKGALTLKAVPQDGDGEGKSSRFELVDEAVIHEFLDAKMIHADLTVSVGGKSFTGHVDYHLDDIHHEHKDEAPKGDAPKEDAPKDADPPEAKPADDAKELKEGEAK